MTGSPGGSWFIRVMHISRGMPLISALHEPHRPGLAVPAHGEVAGLRRLDAVEHVEDDLALLGGDVVVAELAAARRRRARCAS